MQRRPRKELDWPKNGKGWGMSCRTHHAASLNSTLFSSFLPFFSHCRLRKTKWTIQKGQIVYGRQVSTQYQLPYYCSKSKESQRVDAPTSATMLKNTKIQCDLGKPDLFLLPTIVQCCRGHQTLESKSNSARLFFLASVESCRNNFWSTSWIWSENRA